MSYHVLLSSCHDNELVKSEEVIGWSDNLSYPTPLTPRCVLSISSLNFDIPRLCFSLCGCVLSSPSIEFPTSTGLNPFQQMLMLTSLINQPRQRNLMLTVIGQRLYDDSRTWNHRWILTVVLNVVDRLWILRVPCSDSLKNLDWLEEVMPPPPFFLFRTRVLVPSDSIFSWNNLDVTD